MCYTGQLAVVYYCLQVVLRQSRSKTGHKPIAALCVPRWFIGRWVGSGSSRTVSNLRRCCMHPSRAPRRTITKVADIRAMQATTVSEGQRWTSVPAGAAAFAAMKAYEDHQRQNGHPPSHAFVKEMLAGVHGVCQCTVLALARPFVCGASVH